MSLFDLIRYPISTPATAEELKSIPREVFLRWISAVPELDSEEKTYRPTRAAALIEQMFYWQDDRACIGALHATILLKKLLAEYDE